MLSCDILYGAFSKASFAVGNAAATYSKGPPLDGVNPTDQRVLDEKRTYATSVIGAVSDEVVSELCMDLRVLDGRQRPTASSNSYSPHTQADRAGCGATPFHASCKNR